MKLYLASTSPRRRELLATLKIPFEIISPTFEETPTSLSPSEEALYFAKQKARSVADQCPNSLIIGSDTLIDFNGKKLGKPKDAENACRMLQDLSGHSHRVLTSIALLNTSDQSLKIELITATVTFKPLTSSQINEYVATGEPLDKAGAYAIQEKGRDLIESFEGSLETIVGLPLTPLREWLSPFFPSLSKD